MLPERGGSCPLALRKLLHPLETALLTESTGQRLTHLALACNAKRTCEGVSGQTMLAVIHAGLLLTGGSVAKLVSGSGEEGRDLERLGLRPWLRRESASPGLVCHQ